MESQEVRQKEYVTHCASGGTELVEDLIGVVTTGRHVARDNQRHSIIDVPHKSSDIQLLVHTEWELLQTLS